MEKFSHLITVRLNQHKLGDSARASEVIYKANQHLSKTLCCEENEVRATKLEQGVLWVGVLNSVWSQEVFSSSSTLLKVLQGDYGDKMVQKIRIKSLTTS